MIRARDEIRDGMPMESGDRGADLGLSFTI
jgi:hypothetical protein